MFRPVMEWCSTEGRWSLKLQVSCYKSSRPLYSAKLPLKTHDGSSWSRVRDTTPDVFHFGYLVLHQTSFFVSLKQQSLQAGSWC